MDTSKSKENSPADPGKTPAKRLMEDFAADVVITAAIVAAIVLLLNEPLSKVLTSPIFIILTAAGLVHLAYQYFSRRAKFHG